jgi:hypothetical protein
VPAEIFDAFNVDKPDPAPASVVAVSVVPFQVKPDDCITGPVPLPTIT